MNRKVHVRFCESLGVRFPRGTRHVIRREMVASMSTKATKPRELEPSPALPKARKPRARQGIGLCRAQCAQLKLTLDVRCGTETLGQAACRA